MWQRFYEENRGKGFEILSIALDAQGGEKARPYVEKANTSFPTVVDESNLLGQLYGFKAVPNGFLINEQGIVQYKKLGGFDIRRAETAQVVQEWINSSDYDRSSDNSDEELPPEHSDANAHFRQGLELYNSGNIDAAMAEWRKGVELEPDNWIIRKQMWAVQNPDKFYDADVDFDWQKEQIARGL